MDSFVKCRGSFARCLGAWPKLGEAVWEPGLVSIVSKTRAVSFDSVPSQIDGSVIKFWLTAYKFALTDPVGLLGHLPEMQTKHDRCRD
jgi:hypothetical protein